MLYRVKGAILIGIFLTAIISWPRPTSVTYFPHTEAGDSAFDFFKQVVTFRPLKLIGNALDVSMLEICIELILIIAKQWNLGSGRVWYALVTFLYVDILGARVSFGAPLSYLPDNIYRHYRNDLLHGKVRWPARPRHSRF